MLNEWPTICMAKQAQSTLITCNEIIATENGSVRNQQTSDTSEIQSHTPLFQYLHLTGCSFSHRWHFKIAVVLTETPYNCLGTLQPHVRIYNHLFAGAEVWCIAPCRNGSTTQLPKSGQALDLKIGSANHATCSKTHWKIAGGLSEEPAWWYQSQQARTSRELSK